VLVLGILSGAESFGLVWKCRFDCYDCLGRYFEWGSKSNHRNKSSS